MPRFSINCLQGQLKDECAACQLKLAEFGFFINFRYKARVSRNRIPVRFSGTTRCWTLEDNEEREVRHGVYVQVILLPLIGAASDTDFALEVADLLYALKMIWPRERDSLMLQGAPQTTSVRPLHADL